MLKQEAKELNLSKLRTKSKSQIYLNAYIDNVSTRMNTKTKKLKAKRMTEDYTTKGQFEYLNMPKRSRPFTRRVRPSSPIRLSVPFVVLVVLYYFIFHE